MTAGEVEAQEELFGPDAEQPEATDGEAPQPVQAEPEIPQIKGEIVVAATMAAEQTAEQLKVLVARSVAAAQKADQKACLSVEELALAERLFRNRMPTFSDGTQRQPTGDEIDLYIHRIRQTGLDPMANQICAVWRWDKNASDYVMTIQTQIDGYRLIASRSAAYAGSDDAVIEPGQDGKPAVATVTVYRIVGGQRCPFTASARWSEYSPADSRRGFMWQKMPHCMLSKCAESLALRKGFPAELSGIYTHAEMDQAIEAIPSDRPAASPDAPQVGTRAERQTIPADDDPIFFGDKHQYTSDQGQAAYETLVAKYKAKNPENTAEHFRQWCRDELGDEPDWTFSQVRRLTEKLR